jgi:RimK family alpha-L-glutamate ligase
MGALRAAILGKKDGWHVQDLRRTLSSRGIEASCFAATRLVSRCSTFNPSLEAGGEDLSGYDLLFVRSVPGGSLEQVIYRIDALHRLQGLGVRVINPAAVIERSVDKLYTLSILEDSGFPVPATIACEHSEQAMEAFLCLGGDVVVKPLFGSEGRGMLRVSDPDLAYRVFSALEQNRYIYYLQEYLPHDNRDFRVFVVAGESLGVMQRKGTDWRSNVARGARVAPAGAVPEIEKIALEAANLFDADYLGVDVIRVEDGRIMLLEVNGIPGWRGFLKATGINAGEVLVESVLKESRCRRNGPGIF